MLRAFAIIRMPVMIKSMALAPVLESGPAASGFPALNWRIFFEIRSREGHPEEEEVETRHPKNSLQKFAREKGIQKKKKSKLVWDETTQGWSRRWGYKSAKDNAEKNVVAIEHKGNATEAECNENPFAKRKTEKKLETAKQKLREMRNKVEAAGYKMGGANLAGDKSMNSGRGTTGLTEALKRAQGSSASCGKFDRRAKEEKVLPKRGGRTKVNAAISGEEERAGARKMLDKIRNGGLEVDARKAMGLVQKGKEGRVKKGVVKSGKGKKGGNKGKKGRK